ncbi:cation diffusion facilitator family transporter [Thermogladius sp. 4427co]|uniref:cation diffusion facilitator family transporter n=1 Tax=Thermogladius sp. 4427co TaxID=3450718 RepID=UPI003F7A3F07
MADLAGRLSIASKAIKYSFLLGVLGVVVDFIFVYLFSNIILVTDLTHWVIDSLLELTFIVALYFATRISRRYPFGFVVLELTLSLIIAITVTGFYMLNLYLYLSQIFNSPSYTVDVNIFSSVATVVGTVLTLASYRVLNTTFNKYKINILKYESKHALLDSLAGIVATTGIILSSVTKSPAIEILFTIVLVVFIFHSMGGIIEDYLRLVYGDTLDYRVAMNVIELLENTLTDKYVKVKRVEARRLSYFYVINIDLYVDPDTTIREAHRLRMEIIRRIIDLYDNVYHVDVRFYPKRIRKIEKKLEKVFDDKIYTKRRK